MRKNILFYVVAFALLATSVFFFHTAYNELARFAELTQRGNDVYAGFQDLAKEINDAAVINPDLVKARDSSKSVELFFADSQSVIKRLNFLKSTVRDSINIQIVGKLNTAIKSELAWMLKSNVPDSIINHKAPAHIDSLQHIDSLINQGIRRTNFLQGLRKEKLAGASERMIVLMVLFVIISAILLTYTIISLVKQKSKTKEKETELSRKEKHFQFTLDNMLEGIQMHDFNWRYIYVNDALVKYSTYSKEELLGYTLMEKYPGIEQSHLFSVLQRCMKERVTEHMDTEFLFPNGSKAHFELSIQPIPEGLFILSVDRTEQKKTQDNLLKVNRLYAFISAINQSIVHLDNKEELLNNACTIAIETGEFKTAWIGLLDGAGKLNMISMKGDPKMVKELQKYSGLDYNTGELRDTTIGTALRTGMHVVKNDVQNDAAMKPWKEIYEQHQIKSTISLPIKKSGKAIGIFGFHSTVENFFDEKEIDLLKEAVGDISFALEVFENTEKHKITEELVIQNEERFRVLIENTSDGITLTDEFSNVIYRSPAANKITGILPTEKTITRTHPEDFELIRNKHAELLKNPGVPVPFQGRFLHADGHYIWLEGTFTNLLHAKGVNAIVTNFRDVTEKKSSELQLRKSELFNRGVLNSLSSHIAVVNSNGKILAVNESWQRFAIENGNTTLQSAGVGNNYYEVCERSANAGIEFAAEALRGMKDVMDEKNTIFYLEYPCDSPDKKRWFAMRVMKFESGEPMVVVAHENISERRLIEESLRQNEIRLKEAQALTHTGNWEIDLTQNVHTWSDEFYTIYGIDKNKELPSIELFLSFIHPEDSAFAQKKVQDAFDTLLASSFDFRFIRRDGSTRYGYAQWKFEFDKAHKPLRLYGVLRDITESKLAELDKEKMIADIIQRSKNLEQFAYVVSHNLRSPIAHIMGISNILKGDVSEEDRKRSQSFLFSAVEQLDDTIKDLVKILQAKTEIAGSKEIVHLPELIDNIKTSIQSLLENEDVQIITDFSKIDKVNTLKSYAYSIFFNLISNSIKYRYKDRSPVIEIKSELVDFKVRISFKDNGAGIDLKKHGEHIFGLYKRFHLNIEGKGLGLFMVKTQLEVLGGTIEVKSEPGKGSEFVIELPV